MAIVELQDVSVKFRERIVLDKIDLVINEGDFLAVIGPNGGGKTTLLKVILGLVPFFSGKLILFGQNASRKSYNQIGYVPQVSFSDREFPINVLDVVLLGLLGQKRIFSKYQKVDIEKAKKALKSVEMLDFVNRQIGELSEGQRQRVFIARALVSEPKLLLLDEPTASTDQTIQKNIFHILDKLRKEITIVMVTHDISAISTYVDQIACLNVKLHYHGSKEISEEDLGKLYSCPVDLIAHGHPHRVLKEHE